MQLITGVSIKGLRSFQNEDFKAIGPLTVLVGKNSSGKSNVLRALNLFFNDEIEPGKPLLLHRDHHSRPKARQKKEIIVSIDFALPASFHFRKSLQAVKAALGASFRITKKWELDPRQQLVTSSKLIVSGKELPNGDAIASQFLQLVTFRYIPNRTVPSALLREESRLISTSILTRLQGGGIQNVLNAMRTAADRLLERPGDSLIKAGTPLSDIAIANPASFADMLSVSGFQGRGIHGNVVRDEEWGSGSQAFFLYSLLQAVDTNYSRTFGWKQVTVWGVEEPESGLHRDMETRLADNMRT